MKKLIKILLSVFLVWIIVLFSMELVKNSKVPTIADFNEESDSFEFNGYKYFKIKDEDVLGWESKFFICDTYGETVAKNRLLFPCYFYSFSMYPDYRCLEYDGSYSTSMFLREDAVSPDIYNYDTIDYFCFRYSRSSDISKDINYKYPDLDFSYYFKIDEEQLLKEWHNFIIYAHETKEYDKPLTIYNYFSEERDYNNVVSDRIFVKFKDYPALIKVGEVQYIDEKIYAYCDADASPSYSQPTSQGLEIPKELKAQLEYFISNPEETNDPNILELY